VNHATRGRGEPQASFLRIGQAAELLSCSVDTLRRWEEEGRLTMRRSPGGHREMAVEEVRRLLAARPTRSANKKSSARNQLEAVVTKVVKDRVAATVEMQAGSFRLVALTTAESVVEMDLRPGTKVVASVKATNVVVNLPQ